MAGMSDSAGVNNLLRDAAAAEAAFDWHTAAEAYEQALSAGGDAVDEGALLTAVGRCYWNLGEPRTAWRSLRRAISLFQQRSDGVGQALATLEILRIWGPPDRQQAMVDEALEALGDGETALRARLLIRYPWIAEDAEDRWREGVELGERHNLQDVLASRTQNEAWRELEAGRLDAFVEGLSAAHEAYAAMGIHDAASACLRNVGFHLIEYGMLDRGYEFAQRAFDYAMRVRFSFSAQLGLMDMAAVRYARGEFDACEALLAQSPGETDFRADLYRAWMMEARGDVEGALRMIVSPERSGKAPSAAGQIHASAAGVLFRAGRTDAAREAMGAWDSVENRGDNGAYFAESPAMVECLLALADERLLRKVYDVFRERQESAPIVLRFATLQGRSVAPVQAGVTAKLGMREEAARLYREGIEWCEREGCARDAELCRAGLAAIGG